MSPRAWAVLLVLCGAIFLEGIDVAMFNVALPAIRADLGLPASSLQWVISAYVLGYGGFMLIGGRAADLLGRRRMFLFWLAVFLLFSGLGGFATESWMLIAVRFVTGVASAFMAPAGLSIITTSIPEGAQRNRALLIYSGTAAGGFSLGLVIGGLLTGFGWRWVFFAPVVLAAVLLAAALIILPRTPSPAATEGAGGRRLDLPGALAITAALVLLVTAIERASHVHPVWTVATLTAAGVAFALFAVIERRSAAPLVRFGVFRNAALVRANATGLLFIAGFAAFQYVVVLYLQDLRGWSPLSTSLALLVIGIDAVLAPTLTPRLVERFGTWRVITGGLVLAAIGYATFAPLGPDWTYAAMFPAMLLLGLAFALVYGPLTIAGTDGVAEAEHGLAGGLLYTSLQFGTALGMSAATAVMVAATDDGAAGLLSGYRAALLVPLVAAVIAVVVAGSGLRARRSSTSAEPVSEMVAG
ncbi:MFS transporter [Longispora albida]|uniref:MFS transporter n=1 Tax=Longispora albida TaxID=203523 RepID=UPI000590A190|nr:MFS transporter [Longispora albida]